MASIRYRRAYQHACDAHACKQSEDYDGAIKSASKAIKANRGYRYAYELRAVCYSHKGNFKLALADCNTAAGLKPSTSYIYTLRARVHSALGNDMACIADCDQAISLDPKSAYSYGLRGWVKMGQGHHETAIKDFDTSISLQDDEGKTYFWRARALAATDNFEAALKDLESGAALDGWNHHAYLMRARVHADMGSIAKAIEDCDRAMAAAEDSPEPLNTKAYMLCTMPDEKWRNGTEALKLAQRALEICGERPAHILDTLACAYAELGRFDEAIAVQQEAVKKRPEHAVLLEHMEAFKARRPWRE
ncbi:MAG: tetratricopeptide repeat protein [Verrucomicrobia bacterium]|nr:tetratricopeptide repeat protein [Verrucomicrobiota bacterium]MBT7065263.1 tetratricopeptide repeat protein [Verrucomicrobiota bacterium]MBT7700196.1 tetratricopeptide repeat protein [Verrucomicrobiota bacterium]